MGGCGEGPASSGRARGRPHACLKQNAPLADNRTSFYFDREAGTCRQMQFPVGILTPDWLAGAQVVAEEAVAGRPCRVWAKAGEFIRYYELIDSPNRAPARWVFGSVSPPMVMEVEAWEPGGALPEAEWAAPAACFL